MRRRITAESQRQKVLDYHKLIQDRYRRFKKVTGLNTKQADRLLMNMHREKKNVAGYISWVLEVSHDDYKSRLLSLGAPITAVR